MTDAADRSLAKAPAAGQRPESPKAAFALRVEKVSLKIGPLALTDISLHVPAGGLATLCGPVGSGKSTLAAAIAGVHPMTSGRVVVGDDDVTNLPPERRRVGWVPQDAGLLPRQTAVRQIAFPLLVRGIGRAERERAVADIAEEWSLTPLLSRRPDELSGGQARLVSIVRAITSRPGVLMLDEPLASFDANLRDEVMVRLRSWAARTGGGVLIVTHRAGDLADSDGRYDLPSPQ